MNWDLMFFVNSALLGVGLAMDAFSVSLANGLNDTKMKVTHMSFIAGIFALFQAAMPMIGWVCIHTVAQYFKAFEKLIPWIALLLLLFIGGKMLVEGIRGTNPDNDIPTLTFGTLLVQGVATSIDALSVGFTIADYDALMAAVCAIIIAIVTFVICMVGLKIGQKVGTKLSGKANRLGGLILICIGVEIFVKGVFF